jgi:hypothetical protein
MLAGIVASVLAGLTPCCRQNGSVEPTTLPQRAYVWQRDWSAPIAESLREGRDRLDGCVVLAAEVEWREGRPRVVKPKVDWSALKTWGKPVGATMRISPYSGPFRNDDELAGQLCEVAKDLIADAKGHDVALSELQLDFDCAQKKLAGYRLWVQALREAVKPLPLVITTLPSWLGEAEFTKLVQEVPRYVLQVHSVASPLGDARTLICDPVLARKWVARAEAIGHPFEIALPTYRSLVGYGPDGKLLGVASDGVRPNWPTGTSVREYETDASAMAALINGWQGDRPLHCRGILWYRLPVASDTNNWRWPTLRAVMTGRAPKVAWSARVEGANPADLSVRNDGESDEPMRGKVEVRWEGQARPTAEALPGWRVEVRANGVVFSSASEAGVRLPPGGERAIGWLRLDPAVPFHAKTVP